MSGPEAPVDDNPWILRMTQDIDLSALVARMKTEIKEELIPAIWAEAEKISAAYAGEGDELHHASVLNEVHRSVAEAVRGSWPRFIRELRYRNRQTQLEFGVRVGFDHRTISNWERGAAWPRWRAISEVLSRLGLTPQDVIGKAEYRRLTGAAS